MSNIRFRSIPVIIFFLLSVPVAHFITNFIVGITKTFYISYTFIIFQGSKGAKHLLPRNIQLSQQKRSPFAALQLRILEPQLSTSASSLKSVFLKRQWCHFVYSVCLSLILFVIFLLVLMNSTCIICKCNCTALTIEVGSLA